MTSRFGFFASSELSAWDDRLEVINTALRELKISPVSGENIPLIPNAGEDIQKRYETLAYRLRDPLTSRDKEFQENVINDYKESIRIIAPLLKSSAKAKKNSFEKKPIDSSVSLANSNDQWNKIETRPRRSQEIIPLPSQQSVTTPMKRS